MSSTMRAAVVRELGAPLQIDEVERPTPAAGEILIRTIASGVCHTDLHAAMGDWPVKPNPPFIPGHEGVGEVVALGAGVTDVSLGDRVGVPWLHSACGACEFCYNGWETLCESQRNTGYGVNGGFAEYILAPSAYVGRIPDGLDSFQAAPVLCAGVTTYKGIKETDTRPGDWLVVSGVGGLGHMAIQYGVAMGLRVIAVTRQPRKAPMARKLGAEIVIDASALDPAAEVQRLVGGAQGVLVTGVSNESMSQGVGMLRRGGTLSIVGLPPGSFPLDIFSVVLKRLTIRGSIVGTRADLAEALQFAARGAVHSVIELRSLDAVNATFDALRTGSLDHRVVLDLAA